MKKLFIFPGLIITALLLANCASVSTLQRADTTPKGIFRSAIGIGSVTATVSDVSGVDISSDDQNKAEISYPMFEYMGRYGVTDRFDIGVRTTGAVHGLDFKYKLIDGDTFIMSLDAGATYLSYSSTSGTTETKYTAIDLVPAVLFDVNFSKTVGLYIVPKYLHRNVKITGAADVSVGYMGGSVGFRWGDTAGIFVEYTLLKGTFEDQSVTPTLETDVDLKQFAGGFFF